MTLEQDIFSLDIEALRAKYQHFNSQGWVFDQPIPSDVLSVEVVANDVFDANLAFPMGSQYLQGSTSKFWWRPLRAPWEKLVSDAPRAWSFTLAQEVPDFVRLLRVVSVGYWDARFVRTCLRSELVFNRFYYWKPAVKGDGFGKG